MVIIILLVLAVVAAVLYFVMPRKSGMKGVLQSQVLDDSSIKIIYTPLPSTSENSAQAFAAVKKNLSQADLSRTYGLVASSTPTKLPPLKEAKALLASYSDTLKVYDANATKSYECSTLNSGTFCPLGVLRDAGYLAALRPLVYLQENKPADAQKKAQEVAAFGRTISANSTDLLTLLIGWVVQKVGYTSLSVVNTKIKAPALSEEEKQGLIKKMRDEHKVVLRHVYTNGVLGIDLIASDAQIAANIDESEKEAIMNYRKARTQNPLAWNTNETKKYFFESSQKMIANVDAACGAQLVLSTLDLGYDPKDTAAPNYIGKTLYSAGFANFDSLNERRCEIEALINKL